MKKFKSAIIGCGAIHRLHAEALLESSITELYAVCDIDTTRAEKSAKDYNCKAYYDYHDLVKNNDIDVIHLCTPHYLHAPMAIEAMKHGKNVLTEKPIAIKNVDAREMIKVSEETGKALGVCFQNRYNFTVRRTKEIIQSGNLGVVKGVKAFVTWDRDKNYYAQDAWRGKWETEGGGVLINQSIHTLDLLLYLVGEVEKLKAKVDTTILKNIIEVEDTSEAVIVFKNGARGLFYATNCYVANSPVQIEIICEKGVLRLQNDLVITYDNGSSERIGESDGRTGEKAYWGCGHASLINDFYNRLINNQPIQVDGKEGIKALEMINAIYESSKSDQFVEIKS